MVAASAQEKPQPEPRRVAVPPPSEAGSTSKEAEKGHTLPKFDLPEFVITGVASIDLPNVDKLGSEDAAPLRLDGTKESFEGERDRQTYALAMRQKQLLDVVIAAGSAGKAVASWGTYNTPSIGLWLGQITSDYLYLVSGDYFTTKGFAPHTNRSRGSAGLEGGVNLHSVWSLLDNSRLNGLARYGSETYRFYGSIQPSFTRTASRMGIQTSLAAAPESPVAYDLSVRYEQLVLSDSSAETQSNDVVGSLDLEFPAGVSAVVSRVQFMNSTVNGVASTNYPFIDLSIGSSKLWWGSFYLQAAAHFYWAKGDQGQKLTRVYPHVGMGLRLLNGTMLLASYQGGIRYNSLSTFVSEHPYLSAKSVLRHSNIEADVFGAVETDWDEVWRTRFSARYQSIQDYPLYRESGVKGIWDLFYGGRTTINTYSADLFAKFRSNGYFALTIALHSTKNSFSQSRIPYLSDFEITGAFSYWFPFGFHIAPSLCFIDRRNVDILSGARLPEYWLIGMKMEYDLVASLRMFVDVQNATDRKYEQWRGYRALPFVVTGGLSYRW